MNFWDQRINEKKKNIYELASKMWIVWWLWRIQLRSNKQRRSQKKKIITIFFLFFLFLRMRCKAARICHTQKKRNVKRKCVHFFFVMLRCSGSLIRRNSNRSYWSIFIVLSTGLFFFFSFRRYCGDWLFLFLSLASASFRAHTDFII